MTVCDGRVRLQPAGVQYKCVTERQVMKLPAHTVLGLIKYRAKKKAEQNKK
jgi:hypothetical protein